MPKPKHNRQAKAKHDPAPRGPRLPALLVGTNHLTPLWSFQIFDPEGGWRANGGRGLDTDVFVREVISKLRQFETMTWGEILSATHGKQGKSNSHAVELGKITPDAQKRLQEFNLDDADELISLRLTGVYRIWGLRDGQVLRILWFDEAHQVCPSLLR
jgi:hypothetical protein